MTPIRLFVGLLAASLVAVQPLSAIVLIGGDTAPQRQAPPNGAPWAYVAQLDDANGSGVYLGKRFLLTADHVSYPSTIRLNGQVYQPDRAWGERVIDGDDLKLIRLLGDPGLPNLKLIGPGESDRNRKSVLIGWGLGNGTPVANRGWQWGTQRVQRWGTNFTLTELERKAGTSTRLLTAFDFAGGPKEAQPANTDSGSGLFQKFDGIWKLVGIAVDIENGNEFPDAGAYYDNSAAEGLQPDLGKYVRIKERRATIKQIMATSQP